MSIYKEVRPNRLDKIKLVTLGMLIAFFVTSIGLNVYLYQASFLAQVKPMERID